MLVNVVFLFCSWLDFLLLAAGSVNEISGGGFLGTGIYVHIKTPNNDLIRTFASKNFIATLLLHLLYKLKEKGGKKIHLVHFFNHLLFIYL